MARKAYAAFDLAGNERTVAEEMAGALATLASAENPDGSAYTLPVSGTITASGGLTDVQLRATAVPVSGPATDVQLRATALPVSGPVTDVQLRATPVPVSGTVTVTPSGTQAVSVADGADVTQGDVSDAAWASGDGTVISLLKAIHAQLVIIAANTEPA